MSSVPSLPPPQGPPRCPSCHALTPADASGRLPEFCSLCHASLRVAPVPDPVPEPGFDPPPVASDLVAPIAAKATAVTGDAGEAPALDEKVVAAMLIELQAADDDPWVARGNRMSTRASRIMLGVGVAVVVLIIVLVIAVVIGLLVS